MYENDEDIKLMLELKNGNIKAYEEIVGKYKKPIINMIYKNTSGNKEDAEDLAQEVFIKVYNARENYKPKSKFSTWIFKITYNICIDFLRKFKRTESLVEKAAGEHELLIEQIPDPKLLEEEINKNELQLLIRNAVDSLTPQQKTAVILSKFEDLSNEEIAKVLGCSVSAVKSILHRAKLSLKEKLIKSGALV